MAAAELQPRGAVNPFLFKAIVVILMCVSRSLACTGYDYYFVPGTAAAAFGKASLAFSSRPLQSMAGLSSAKCRVA